MKKKCRAHVRGPLEFQGMTKDNACVRDRPVAGFRYNREELSHLHTGKQLCRSYNV